MAEAPIFLDANRPLEKRLADLVRRMSLAENVAQLRNSAPAIPRLSIPAYDDFVSQQAAEGHIV